MIVDRGIVESVYDVIQLPDDSVHAAGLNVPPAPLSLNNMVPVGVMGDAEVSVTVTVNVVGVPGLPTAELGETVTVVESGVLETDVLLLLVNIKELLSAIAGRTVKPPKRDEQNTHVMSKNMVGNLFHLFLVWCIKRTSSCFLYAFDV